MWRQKAIDAGMNFFRASGAHRLAEPFTRGLGAILMFHRVRPRFQRSFEPNQPLEISPVFLDVVLTHLEENGHDILSLDDALARVASGAPQSRPFAVLTFDDGYRDLADFALPVLERHRAPFTVYVTSGFAEGSARLWWVEMEKAIRRLDHLDVIADGERMTRACRTGSEKSRAFIELYWRLRKGGEAQLLRVANELCIQAGVETKRLTEELCLDWSALSELARSDLVTIGAHTLSHPRLAKLDAASARREMGEGKRAIEEALGVDVRHFSYPVGDQTSAGAREFELARELGFASAVTTRPGMIFSQHCDHLHALPRLSVNGRHQSIAALDILLSGAPFALMNRGRKVLAA